MSQDDTEAKNNVEEENDVSEAPAEETEVKEVQEAQTEETDELNDEQSSEDSESSGEEKLTRKEKRQSRLAEVNQQLREQNQLLQQNLTPQQEKEQKQRLSELLQGREEVKPEELDQIAEQWATQNSGINNVESIVELKLAQREALANARNEVAEVLNQEEFNPDSDSYNPNLEKATLRTWERAARVQYDADGNVVSFDPTVSIKEIADQYKEVAESYANTKMANTSAALSKQADEGAVTGGTKTAKSERKFSELSIDEMEKQLGYAKT